MRHGLLIRRAVAADAGEACDAVRASIAELCQADHRNDERALDQWLANKTESNFAAWVGSDRHVAFVAQAGAAVAGFALLSHAGELALLYVAPSCRFQGVSKALLAAIEREAVAAGLSEVHLRSTRTAHRFYLDRGFELAGEPAAVFGVGSGLPMRKRLAP